MIEYGLSNLGLGTTIGILSMLLDSKLPVQLNVPSDSIAHILKTTFNLDSLTLVTTENIINDLNGHIGDHGKFYSPYITADTINVLGQIVTTGRRYKPMIGLAMSNRCLQDTDLENIKTTYPDNRFYSLNTYNQITKLIFKSGYDVISLNDHSIPLESKIYFLNEFCDAVVSYEGGIAHLAHTLKIPVIMFPWHHSPEGSNKPADYATHRYHIDRRTYFLNSEDEILSWDKTKFKEVIHQLYNNQGNNIYYHGSYITNPQFQPWLTNFERDFINQYIIKQPN